jgi:hypothetical protein
LEIHLSRGPQAMAELTIEQRKAVALAKARQRAAQSSGQQDSAGQPASAEDVLKSGASGVARGALDLAGLPGTIGDALNAGGQFAMRKGYELVTGDKPSPDGGMLERMFAGPTQEVRDAGFMARSPLGGASLKDAASRVTNGATNYEPKSTAGEYASTIGEFLPGAAAFGGMSAGNLARFGVLPGAASEAAGQATEGTSVEPYARIAAALAAPAAPALLNRAISPMSISPQRKAAAALLKREGVTPTAGQISGNKSLKYMESEMGGNKAAQMMDDQAEAFTSAAMRKAGGAGRATPENMTALKDRLTSGFDDISARNTLKFDKGVADDINKTMNEYAKVLPTEQRKIVGNMAQDIVDRFKAGNGSIPGSEYQTIRSRLGKRAFNARNTDAELSDAYRGLRNALDEGMNRSINPQDAGKWAQLRKEYGNMKTLENAATGAGEDAALGIISPAKLRQAATTGNRGGYARGEGDFAELSRAGNALMTQLPNSGTAGRLSARNLGAGVSSIVGAGTGAAVTGGTPFGAIAGAAIGSAVPAAAGRALMSKPVQSYLTNQLAQQISVTDPRYAAILQALMSQNQAVQGR